MSEFQSIWRRLRSVYLGETPEQGVGSPNANPAGTTKAAVAAKSAITEDELRVAARLRQRIVGIPRHDIEVIVECCASLGGLQRTFETLAVLCELREDQNFWGPEWMSLSPREERK